MTVKIKRKLERKARELKVVTFVAHALDALLVDVARTLHTAVQEIWGILQVKIRAWRHSNYVVLYIPENRVEIFG